MSAAIDVAITVATAAAPATCAARLPGFPGVADVFEHLLDAAGRPPGRQPAHTATHGTACALPAGGRLANDDHFVLLGHRASMDISMV